MIKKLFQLRGFTLVEILIVMGIIAILAGVGFTLLNPQKRFEDARNSKRITDITAIASALKLYQVDAGGYPASVNALAAGSVYMIVDGATTIECASVAINGSCRTDPTPQVAGGADCVDLSALSTGTNAAIATIPIAPPVSGATVVAWDTGTGGANIDGTGYTLTRNLNGSVTVRACQAEPEPSAAEITVIR